MRSGLPTCPELPILGMPVCSDLSMALPGREDGAVLPHDVLISKYGHRHTSTELTSLLSIELDSLRSFIFSNVSRDRGLRAILEASGAVLVIITATA